MASHFLVIRPLMLFAGLVSLTGCTLRPVVVHPVRIKVAQPEFDAVSDGAVNPNEFHRKWSFSSAEGYVYDASKIEFASGVARHKLRIGAIFPYALDRVVIETTDGVPYKSLIRFTENLGAENRGKTGYQLSPDGMRWFYHDGRHWQETVLNQKNTNNAHEVDQKIKAFAVEAGVGGLWIRLFLITPDGKQPAEIQSFEVAGEQPSLDYHQD